jgi:hypothetical protein
MSSTKLSTSESQSEATPLITDSFWSDRPMPVTVTVAQLKKQQLAYRRYLVKKRRNELAQAAKYRKAGEVVQHGLAEAAAAETLKSIRRIDARLGLLDLGAASTRFTIDLRDEDLVEFGFGMDQNGNYPAL